MDIMKMGKNPNYLGSWDLDDAQNGELVLTIAKIVDEDVTANGKAEACTVCYWKEAGYKPMILNVTNKKTIAKLYKTKDTDKLVGKAVVIGTEKVKAFGDIHDALRIKKRIPQTKVYTCTDCGSVISDTPQKSAGQILAYSRAQYKTDLCFDCIIKRNNAKNSEKKDGAE